MAQKNDVRPMFVVGIGASAGGLEALSSFFDHLPAGGSFAFVVVTHQSPNAQRMLAELLGRRSKLPVEEARDGTPIVAGRVYVAPPRPHLVIENGALKLVPALPDGGRLPIDRFFRSLARDAGERAVGIVLSGSGSDGTLGLKEIKSAGGMVMAQSEDSAAQPDMPRSAIASESVDYVLAAEELPCQLVDYAAIAEQRLGGNEPTAESGDPFDDVAPVLELLRAHTRRDFSAYKPSTVQRRIARRMNVHRVATLADYLLLLRHNPAEIDVLFKELLIGVTSFFRDPEAFAALEQLLPPLLTEKAEELPIRAWVAGCSTGEEAYSIAILIRECADRLQIPAPAQMFATDLDATAIDVARAGIYPESIAQDVSQARLARFFDKEEGCYRIKKEIREMLIFAPQNLIDDPPFTKLDLLSCRNLFIYLSGKLQERLISVFHYALRPGGVLFLGPSETLGKHAHLFEAADKRWKLFNSVGVPGRGLEAKISKGQAVEPQRSRAGAAPRRVSEVGVTQLAERALFNELVPPSVVVHERGEIVHVHGRTGKFLEPAPGSQERANVFKMAREGLQLDLAAAVRQAAIEGEALRRGVRVRANGGYVSVDLRVNRLALPEALRGLFIIAFERAEPEREAVTPEGASHEGVSERVLELERELFHAKEVHQSVIEELETTNEELKSTNEELQSTNEELQSANEELETSKEEMQSLNEELHALNAELHVKVEELSRANDDMKNLLNATSIATMFLDQDLNIKRFTEQVKKVIRLIASDVGRPVGDLVSKLHYDTLIEDCEEVLRTLVFREREVRSESGDWYLMRILPYRTVDNAIDGLVVTFDDLNKVKALQTETERVLGALRDSPTTVFMQDMALRYVWTSGRVFEREPGDVIGRRDVDFMPLANAEQISELKRAVLESGSPGRKQLQLSLSTIARTYDLHVAPLRDAEQTVVGITGVVTEI